MSHVRLALVVVAAALALVAIPTAGSAPAATRLVATVGPGFTITLKTASGTRVRVLKPGTYTITVRDRSNIHNFHLKGPGVNKDSGVSVVATRTWTVRFRAGKYVYVCDPHAESMRGTFTVR